MKYVQAQNILFRLYICAVLVANASLMVLSEPELPERFQARFVVVTDMLPIACLNEKMAVEETDFHQNGLYYGSEQGMNAAWNPCNDYCP